MGKRVFRTVEKVSINKKLLWENLLRVFRVAEKVCINKKLYGENLLRVCRAVEEVNMISRK